MDKGLMVDTSGHIASHDQKTSCFPERVKCTLTPDLSPAGKMVYTPLTACEFIVWTSRQSCGCLLLINTGAQSSRMTDITCNRGDQVLFWRFLLHFKRSLKMLASSFKGGFSQVSRVWSTIIVININTEKVGTSEANVKSSSKLVQWSCV